MYEEKKFALGSLKGLSEKQVSEHLKLYSGYVKNTNELLSKLEAGISSGWDAYTLAELRRRMGFEFNGMRLHEYYFKQFESGSVFDGTALKDAVLAQYASLDNWRSQVSAAAMARGAGWVLLLRDRAINKLMIQWVSDHDMGMIAGVDVIMALDVWEHAYLLDYLPSRRKDYIAAFFDNLNWSVLESRFERTDK
ncbi:MAG: Fe-Mn family superoxide dismutase [Candidatus Paceibacterota bacterium]|jgi:Fe-Mn family superoxide dismutase